MILGIHKVLTHPRVYTRTKWPWSFKLNLLKKMDEKLKEISTCNICFVFHLISWSKICFLLWEVPVPFADLFFHSCLLFLPNKPLSTFCCFFTLFFVKLTFLFKNFLLLCEAIVLHSFLKILLAVTNFSYMNDFTPRIKFKNDQNLRIKNAALKLF